VQSYPNIWVVLTDANGRKLFHSVHGLGDQPPVTATAAALIEQAVKSKQPAISGAYIGGTVGFPVLSVTLPVIRAGKPRYCLFVAFSPDAFLDVLNQQNLPEGWYAGLADRSGNYIARTRGDRRLVGTLASAGWRGVMHEDGWSEFPSLEGDMLDNANVISPLSGWAVAVAARKDLVDAPIRQTMLWGTLIGGAVTLCGLLLALFAARRITLPINALEVGAQALEKHEMVGSQPTGVHEVDRALMAFQKASAALIESETTLRQSEERLRATVDTAVDAIIVIDQDGVVQSVNPAVERIFDYQADEIVGSNVTMLMPEPYRSAHAGHLARYVETGVAKIIGIGREVEGQRKDGTTFPVDLAVAEWTMAGRRFFTGIMRDITARKLAEERLSEAKKEAERANLAKSKFLAAASHDLRQPVQAMILFAHALAKRLKGHPALPVVQKMMKAQDRFKELLDSVLDLSKLDAGLVAPDLQPVASSDLLDELAASYQMRAREKGLKFKIRRGDAWLWADRTLLARILGNLLDNAIKYTPKGGILLSGTRSGDRLRFDVVDTGIGFAREHWEEIFDEFVQLGEVGREQRQGMGLGLATVKRLCDLLDYDLKVWSRPGWGSKFSVFVPLAVTADGALAAESVRVTEAGKCLLVIDDDTAILESIKILTEEWGYEVVTATSFAQALDQVDRCGPPDAIVSDFRLGDGVTGPEVVQAIRARAKSNIPAVVITGDTGLRDQEELVVLYKPMAPEVLQRALWDACHEGGKLPGKLPLTEN
jgi:PAS domain S-box-containing protein